MDEAIKEKINAAGSSVSPILNLLDSSGTVRTSITEEEKQNIEKGLYNSVQYYDSSLGEIALYSIYFPENATSIVDGEVVFSIYKLVQEGEGFSISSLRIYSLYIGDKNLDGTYPITIEDTLEAPFGSSVSPRLNLLDFSGPDDPTVRTSITEEEKINIDKGLYNSVLYYDAS